MGQYIQLGICCKATISKRQMEESVTYEQLIEEMNKEINLDLYDITEDEEEYVFILKNENLKKGDLIKFLQEQYELCYAEKDDVKEIIDILEKTDNSNDIISIAKEKKYQNFQYNDYVYENIYCTKWRHRISVQYELIVYFIQGKILMECYYDFLRYIENIISKNSSNKLSSTVKAVIS